MKLVTWVLISISILTLLFLRCPCENIYENMEAADAVSIANEYIDNLTKQRDNALTSIVEAQGLVSTTGQALENQIRLIEDTPFNTSLDGDELIAEQARVNALTATKAILTSNLAMHNKDVIYYTNEVTRYNRLIDDEKEGLAKLITQSENAPTETPNDGIAFVAKPDNTMVELKPTGDLGGAPTYYEPGTYKFGSATYVPSYEDSVYLSKTTGQSSVSTYLDKATMMGGACSYYKDHPDKLEEMCKSIDTNNCGAMSCCVLLGGAKCVSGNKSGPYNKLNYGDITVRDKDYYYHNGKCYGNCK